MSSISASLAKAKIAAAIEHAKRYRYDTKRPFEGPCIFQNGGALDPIVVEGHKIDGEWDFGTNQVSLSLVSRKDAISKIARDVYEITIRIQDSYTLVDKKQEVTTVERFRVHEVCVYNDTTRSENIHEGKTSDAGNKDTATLLRGSWHWCRLDFISDTQCEVTYERMAGSACAPVRYGVFMEPKRQGYYDDNTGDYTLNSTCKILEYRPVPGLIATEKLRVFESSEALGEWINWYESEHDIHERNNVERTYVRRYRNKKTKEETYGTVHDNDFYEIYTPYHIIEFAYGESPIAKMNKLLGVMHGDKDAEIQADYARRIQELEESGELEPVLNPAAEYED
jgi:hypothetical protein